VGEAGYGLGGGFRSEPGDSVAVGDKDVGRGRERERGSIDRAVGYEGKTLLKEANNESGEAIYT
jgi:hypothetical protein